MKDWEREIGKEQAEGEKERRVDEEKEGFIFFMPEGGATEMTFQK